LDSELRRYLKAEISRVQLERYLREKKIELEENGYAHGEPRTYKRGCRCDECRAAIARQRADSRSKRKREVSHGTTAMYKYGCRCPSCVEAKKVYDHAYRARLRGHAEP